ncbi:ribonuclease regulator [Vibrio methylphosphonaticus]|uniref:ribonuclease regulator n=1 Tax=Vibrio methylphosphonaticus TaxID=2946866 RepID=UPI00202AC18C|nr:ribonuclease regulator [Vibrio methylphosphonaticus]MCL9773360.1 ribonuclease regulator [Vibrio methylphosphonaticus]
MKAMIASALFILWSLNIARAAELPALPSQHDASPHNFFLVSDSKSSSNNLDQWNVDSGYAYSVFDSVDVYIGARLNNSLESSDRGFLSGMSYQVSERISVKSMLRGYQYEENDVTQSGMAAEISSRMRLTENLDVHATFDFEKVQQGVEVGLGFRF